MMLVKRTADCPPQIAIDGCTIREVLHPVMDPVALPYSLAVAEVAVGARTYRHRLQHAEVYYLINGHGRMHIDDDSTDVAAGEAIVIPAGALQWIENRGLDVLRFIAFLAIAIVSVSAVAGRSRNVARREV